MNPKLYILPFLMFLTLANNPIASANQKNIKINSKIFKLKLGASRLIYKKDSRGSAITVFNEQDYPILVQGKVYKEDKKTHSNFIVTPPVFRLDPQQQNRLRVININELGNDKQETLYWLCIAGIPPKNSDLWAQNHIDKDVNVNLEVSAHQCIKLIFRPGNLDNSVLHAAENIKWELDRGRIKVTNTSPYYINFKDVYVGDKKISNVNYLSPFSSSFLNGKNGNLKNIKWSVISDEGGESTLFKFSS